MIKILKKIISPKKCIKCQKNGNYLCETCLETIWYYEDTCYVCKQKSVNFENHWYCKNDTVFYDKIIILAHYKNKDIKYLVKQSKFHNKYDILDTFWKYLSILLKENIWDNEKIILISSPMYFLKKLKRWYNQAEILTKNISKYSGCEFNNKIVKKIRTTQPQSHLSKTDRIINLSWVFKINQKELQKYKNYTFVVVDDVISTWTTINEIAKILKKYKIQKIIWLSIASW